MTTKSRVRRVSLQQEVGEDFPLDSVEQEAHLSIIRTANALENRINRLFRPYDLTGVAYNILRVLERAGKDGLPCSDIGRRLITEVPDMTRLLDRLEQLGYVARLRCTKDRRVVRARIVPKGRKAIRDLRKTIETFHQEQLGHMSPQKLRLLVTLLAEARGASH